MQNQTVKRFLTYALLFASFALTAASAKPQEQKKLPIELPIVLPIKGGCPNPIAVTLTATNPTTFDSGDFSLGQQNAPHMSGLGDPAQDKNFLYTFKWKRPSRCCQITRAVLTVKMKANLPGYSTTSADAGNDGIAIMYQGNVVPPHNEAVYLGIPRPFPKGQPASKSWTLSPAALANLNASGQLSFAVQDETSVVSATLQLWGCCLTIDKIQTAGEATERN